MADAQRIKFLFLIIVASLIPTSRSYHELRPELVHKKDDGGVEEGTSGGRNRRARMRH